MTEFDFDELDKAVNSIMSGADTTKRNPAFDDPEEKVVQLDGVAAPAAHSQSASTVGTVTEPSKSLSLATKRRGQFMDIVHPTSTMRPAQRVSRQAPVVQPVATPAAVEASVVPDVVETSPAPVAAPASLAMSFDMESTAVASERSTMPPEVSPVLEQDVAEAPDEITVPDVAAEPTAPVANYGVNDTAAPSLPDTDDDLMISEQLEQDLAKVSADSKPLMTPFLADAKVDKRPLGEPVAMTVPELTSPAPAVPPVVVPEVAEADNTQMESGVASVEQMSDGPALDDVVAAEAIAPASSIEPQVPAAATVVVPAGGSIVQQYDEAKSTGPQTSAPIYDTETYHQPIDSQKPEKKKSSAIKWIIWIFILIFIGAAIGAGYYYFTRG